MDQTSSTYQEAVDRFAGASPGRHCAAAEALIAAADGDPGSRQPATDTICAWLRTSGDEAERRDVLRLLTDRLRDESAPWEHISVDLAGATLFDADFSGCTLEGAGFADTRFHGRSTFDGADLDDGASFQRAVFYGDASFRGTRFGGDAEFGRTRFRGAADFTGAQFDDIAWFGRGSDEWEDDDEAWDTVEEIDPAPWDEPNEADPGWPVAVLIGDYQDWEEGGDGARFVGVASFRDARFGGPAWFHYARFGAAADFGGAHFAGRVHLDQPAVDLTGARWGGGTEDGESVWPLGWTADPDLVADAAIVAHTRGLTGPDPRLRAEGLQGLARLGDDRPELRQQIVVTLCAFLRTPLPFDLRADGRTAEQAAVLRTRAEAQRLLAERLRPGPAHWPDMSLFLCGATLVDLDLSGCRGDYADFAAAGFYGVTRFDGNEFDRMSFSLDGYCVKATFHGEVVFGAAVPEDVIVHGAAG